MSRRIVLGKRQAVNHPADNLICAAGNSEVTTCLRFVENERIV